MKLGADFILLSLEMRMKKLIAISAVAAMVTSALASEADLQKQIDELNKKLDRQAKTLRETKKQAAADNIKFDIDFRTSMDRIEYKTVSGEKYTNQGLFSNRLWLGMGYAPTDEMIFKGQLSYNKAYGASAAGANGMPQRGFGYDTFDWVVNESLTDSTLKVREAYWLYMSDHLFGSDVGVTASIGRRPSTNGFLANFREDDQAKSPLGHVINVEFDGASVGFKLGKVTGVDGMRLKFCFGRGLTNAGGRFNPDGSGIDYIENDDLDTVDLAGFIFVPYDDGQYHIETTYYRGFNVPGYAAKQMNWTGANPANPMDPMNWAPDMNSMQMETMGDMDGAAISVLVDGIGDGISDFLDDTLVFGSFAWSKTRPSAVTRTFNSPQGPMDMPTETMLGSSDSETGTSFWLGTQFPAVFTDDGRIGLEYNHGSEYWRAFTYGEDTMIGSKLAVRGDAYEAYYTQPLGKAFSMQIRYTYIDYSETGSNAFFGDGGMSTDVDDPMLAMMGFDPVDSSSDLRLYFRYRY
jgi:hypothetical protein